MTSQLLANCLQRTPVYAKLEDAQRIKLAFLLNLIGEREFTEVELRHARDSMVFAGSRALINDLLGLREVEHAADLADQHAPTTMPLALMVDDKKLAKRIVMYLRPDPKMTVEVEKKETDTEPRLEVFQVCIEDGRGGSWMEAFENEDVLRAFLRGIRVTYAMSDLNRLLPDFGDNAPFSFTEQSVVQHLP